MKEEYVDDLDDRFIIFKKEQPDERNRIKVQVEKSGQIYVMQANGADGAYAQTSAGCYPKSGWHHIALVYDGTKTSTDEGVIILYIDGIRCFFRIGRCFSCLLLRGQNME